jgi:hypothetical protein
MSNIISTTDFFNDVADKLANEIAYYSPQIFCDRYKKARMPVYPDCSSVLLTIAGRYFLLTAGHCVHEIDHNSIGIMIENDFFTIGGHMEYFEANTNTFYEPNNLDVAIYELDNEAVCAIDKFYSCAHEMLYKNIFCILCGSFTCDQFFISNIIQVYHNRITESGKFKRRRFY